LAEVVEIKPALERFPEYFAVIDTVIDKLDEWIHKQGPSPHKSALDYVKIATIIRTFNIYRSIRLLLSYDHWEDAATVARTLFELLLNLEEILRDESDAERKAHKYLRYSKLQDGLHISRDVEYEIATGRCSEERKQLLHKLKQTMKVIFKEFLDKKSWSGWKNSWCDKSVYKLASESKNSMRIHNYKIIYSHFSELSHSTPYGALTAMTQIQSGEDASLSIEKQEDTRFKARALINTIHLPETASGLYGRSSVLG